jgi:nucleoside-diphosphate-sugar epimerase
MYIDDLVKGILLVLEKGKAGEVYNVGSNKQTTILELAELVIRLTKSDNGVEFRPHFIEDHNHRLPSVEKAESLGWSQEVSLEEGLRRMISLYKIKPKTKKTGGIKVKI